MGGNRLMRARVFVTLKPSVFDPQGTTVGEALHTLGYTSVTEVRQGKYFELEIDAPPPEQADEVCRRRVPRLQLRSRRALRGVAGAGTGRRADLAQGHEPARRRR